MHQHRVAVDDGLNNYRPLLAREGYEVVALGAAEAAAEAVLLSGQDANFTGDAARASAAFTIDVTGRQPEEVLFDLRQRFALKGEGPLEPLGVFPHWRQIGP